MSAAYQTVLRVRRGGFRWLAGEDNITRYRLPGTHFNCAFCRTCGARTPWKRDKEHLVVPAGCLDTDPTASPTDNIFADSRAAWTVIDASLETYPNAASWYRPPPDRS